MVGYTLAPNPLVNLRSFKSPDGEQKKLRSTGASNRRVPPRHERGYPAEVPKQYAIPDVVDPIPEEYGFELQGAVARPRVTSGCNSRLLIK